MKDATVKKPKVLIIVGPTASGKTRLSIELAKQFNGEVLSADSRQVYRGLDIGTEKVRPEEMKGVPHHLIDVADVENVFTAADFKAQAAAAIDRINGRGRLPIIAGGTFFYIDTLLGKITPAPVAPNQELRDYYEDLSTEMLYTELERIDPERAFSIEKDNKRRLVRALEIAQTLGSVPKPSTQESPYDVLVLGIATERSELRAGLAARAAAAVQRGLINETESLLKSGVSRDRLSEIGLEYRLVLQHLDGEIDMSELLQRLTEKNWQYAKRQLTWLKRDDSIHWFENTDIKAISTLVQHWLSN